MVDGRLEALDATGQKGESAPFSFRLPARVFTDPLARALIEQRQHLATSDAAGRKTVLLTLDALAINPERFYQDKNDIFLAVRSAFNGVKNAKTEGRHHAGGRLAVADRAEVGARRPLSAAKNCASCR
jgi:hypothetical protein